jgi:hypothetical protein
MTKYKKMGYAVIAIACFFLLAMNACAPPSNRNGNANNAASSNRSSQQLATTPAPTQPNTPTSTQPQSTPQPNLPPGQLRVTKQELGEAWPLTVDEGILSCSGSSRFGEVVLIVQGKKYAVNGVAMGQKINGKNAYADISEIQAKDPRIPGIKKSVSPLIDRGLKLCQ